MKIVVWACDCCGKEVDGPPTTVKLVVSGPGWYPFQEQSTTKDLCWPCAEEVLGAFEVFEKDGRLHSNPPGWMPGISQ